MDGNDYLELLKQRYSCRKFSDEQVEDEHLHYIFEAAHQSPSAKNNQSVQFCVVQSAEGLARIDECTPCRYGAPTVVIAAYDTELSAKVRGPETCDFGDIDSVIALTNMANAAASVGVQTCWVGKFDPDMVRKHFNVPEQYRLVELMMFGYAQKDDPASSPSERHYQRRSITDLVVPETF